MAPLVDLTAWSDLPLTPAHATHLAAAAIEPEVARRAGIWSVVDPAALPEEFAYWGPAVVPALVLPYRSPQGLVVPQLRPDTPVTDSQGNVSKYLFPKGAPCVFNQVHIDADADLVLIVEGTKQALAAASYPPAASIYGMAGAWNWQAQGIPTNDLVVVEGRSVIVVLDADAADNLDVYNGGMGLRDAALAMGATSVRFLRLPGRKTVGLDDVLAGQLHERRGAFLERLITQAADKPADKAPKRSTASGTGGRYFDDGGLRAATLARDVMADGPLAEGTDDVLWAYEHGVWKQARHVVRNRCVFKLGERFRAGHVVSVEPVVRTWVPQITCEPISELINFRNGALVWRTGELVPHSHEVLTTVQLAVDHVPGAVCPAFDEFLAQVLPTDMIEVVWELIGYLMYSGNPLHKAVMLTGTGRNGKGTLLRVITRLLGKHNVTSVSLHDLVNTRFTTASLFGKLANIAGDIDGTYIESTATFKAITGEDQISAEYKGRDRFDFTPWAVPVFSANKVPASADTTVGYLSRWLVVNFPHDFTGREDRTLEERLTTPAELAGIAARAVARLPHLLDRGDFDQTSASAVAARAEFIRRVDHVQTWLDDCTRVDPQAWVARTELYQSYQNWCFREGHRYPVKATEFYDRLRAPETAKRGVQEVTRRGARGFKGLALNGGGVVEHNSDPRGDGKPPADYASQLHPASPQGKVGLTSDDAKLPDGRVQGVQQVTSQFARAGAREKEKDVRAGAREIRARAGAGDAVSTPAPPAPPAPPVSAARCHRVRRAATGLLTDPEPLTDLSRVWDELQAVVKEAGALTVDVETSGFPVGHRHHQLRTVQLGTDQVAFVFDVRDDRTRSGREARALVRAALAGAPKLHAHSATADLVPLARAGMCDESAWERMHDTVIPAKLADPASTGSDPGLKQLAATVLNGRAVTPVTDAARAEVFKRNKWITNTKPTTALERSGWAQIDPASAVMLAYAASDVLDTGALVGHLPEVPTELIERERAVQAVTARLTHRGMRVDREAVEALARVHTGARDAAAEHIRAMGIDNPGSNPQVAQWLTYEGVTLPATPTGRPSVAESVLEKLRGAPGRVGELIEAVLEHREHAKVLSSFVGPYRQAVVHGDGRVYPTIYTLAADTGRMSCVRPNLQQVPREGGVRRCLTADPGMLLISADFSGVELRVAAALSQDRTLLAMMADNEDLHWRIARQVWGPDATKGNRYIAKRIVFGRLYGGGVPTLARQAGVSEAVARQAVDTLDRLTPDLAGWAHRWREATRAGHTGFKTYSGRTIHLQTEYPHKTPNYLIQGTARELFVDALLRWRITPWGGAVVLPVHDEIVAVVSAEQAQDATSALVACMTTQLHGVQIVAEASEPSYAWADAA
jgi:P4 family phage/plasmid primase-like protien